MNLPQPKKSLWLLGSMIWLMLTACGDKPPSAAAQPAKPALTVTVTAPQLRDWPQTLAASGNVAAWQEAIIGPEINNYRITEVLANVGDTVAKGDVTRDILAAPQGDGREAQARAGS